LDNKLTIDEAGIIYNANIFVVKPTGIKGAGGYFSFLDLLGIFLI